MEGKSWKKPNYVTIFLIHSDLIYSFTHIKNRDPEDLSVFNLPSKSKTVKNPIFQGKLQEVTVDHKQQVNQ